MFKKWWNWDFEEAVAAFFAAFSGCALLSALVSMILPCIIVGGLGFVIWKVLEYFGVL